jgi:hypothetical protein
VHIAQIIGLQTFIKDLTAKIQTHKDFLISNNSLSEIALTIYRNFVAKFYGFCFFLKKNLNRDYIFGHSFSEVIKEMLKVKRPDIQIVGDTFHPLGKVKDFSPYITKIQASGADVVVTGNWGVDMQLLNKAGKAEPKAVAYALEGMEHDTYYGKVAMRAEEHQLYQPMFISTMVKAGSDKVPFDVEKTGLGWRTDMRVDNETTMRPTVCKMERP